MQRRRQDENEEKRKWLREGDRKKHAFISRKREKREKEDKRKEKKNIIRIGRDKY